MQNKRYWRNQDIRAKEMRVIDEDGKNLGVLQREEALRIAQEKELDLVQITQSTFPPVCRIIDFGQFKYREEKELKKQKTKQKTTEIKGIRLGVNIGEHDIEVRTKQAEKFLEEGHKVKIELMLRGRQRAHPDVAREKIQSFLKTLPNIILEQTIKQIGPKLSCLICRKNSKPTNP